MATPMNRKNLIRDDPSNKSESTANSYHALIPGIQYAPLAEESKFSELSLSKLLWRSDKYLICVKCAGYLNNLSVGHAPI